MSHAAASQMGVSHLTGAADSLVVVGDLIPPALQDAGLDERAIRAGLAVFLTIATLRDVASLHELAPSPELPYNSGRNQAAPASPKSIALAAADAEKKQPAGKSETDATDPTGRKEVDTGVKICTGYLQGDIIFSWFPSHEFLEIDGTGYGMYEKNKNVTGTAVVKNDENSVYPDPAKPGRSGYSVRNPFMLDDGYYDIDKFKQGVRDYIAQRTANPGSYSAGTLDCYEFVRSAIAAGLKNSRNNRPMPFRPAMAPF